MTDMSRFLTPPVLYAIFAIAALIELYFFAMQRSSLEISRAADIHPRDGRMMLPYWYLWSWPARLIKWGAAIAIGVTVHWGVAVGLLAVPFVLSATIPIPHRHFIRFFRQKVRADLARGENENFFSMLDGILDRAEMKLDER